MQIQLEDRPVGREDAGRSRRIAANTVETIARLTLGALFLWAGTGKLWDLESFVAALAAHDLLAPRLLDVTASVAPDETTGADAVTEWVTFARQNHNNGVGSTVWNGFITYLVFSAPKPLIPEILDAYAASGDTTLQAYAGLQRAGVKAFPGL